MTKANIIKGLECCANEGYCADNYCPYETKENCRITLCKDALKLLEQNKETIECLLGIIDNQQERENELFETIKELIKERKKKRGRLI